LTNFQGIHRVNGEQCEIENIWLETSLSMEIGIGTVEGEGRYQYSGAATHCMHAVKNLDAVFPVCRRGEGHCLATTIP
jgi:hypothetical protein